MPSLQSVLGSLPGIAGYEAAKQQNAQTEMQQLQKVGALQQILGRVQAQQQKAQSMQEESQLKAAISQSGGDLTKVMQAALASGNVAAAARLAPLIEAQRKASAPQQGQSIGSGGLRLPDGTIVPPAARPEGATPKAPPMRTRVVGETQIQEELQPNGTWKEVGKGPRFARQVAPGGIGDQVPPVQGDFSKTGDDYLGTLPVSLRNTVKGVANYEIDPKTFAARLGNREKMLEMVKQYRPDYDDTQYANKRRAIAQFGSGPQGNTVRSLNVAIEHIDTLKRAGDALKNGEFTPGNKAYNEVAKVFGVTPPNTFEGIRDIVANEVVKGTIGNAGALQDRTEAAAKVKASASPEQLNELMNGWVELMGGQVKGLEQQYSGSTGLKDFRNRYLTQRAIDAIGLAESKTTGGIREFATEAEAAKAGLKPGTKIKIGGRPGTWQ